MQNSKTSKAACSSSSTAADELDDLIKRFNRNNPDNQITLSLNELIYVVVRLGDSVMRDPSTDGRWSVVVQEVRRRLYNKLNEGAAYRAAVKASPSQGVTDGPEDSSA